MQGFFLIELNYQQIQLFNFKEIQILLTIRYIFKIQCIVLNLVLSTKHLGQNFEITIIV